MIKSINRLEYFGLENEILSEITWEKSWNFVN